MHKITAEELLESMHVYRGRCEDPRAISSISELLRDAGHIGFTEVQELGVAEVTFQGRTFQGPTIFLSDEDGNNHAVLIRREYERTGEGYLLLSYKLSTDF